MGYLDKMFGTQKQNDRARYDDLLGKGHKGSEALHIINMEKNQRKERERAEPREHEWRESYLRPPRQEKKRGGGIFGALTGSTAQNFYQNMGGYGGGGSGHGFASNLFGDEPRRQLPKKHHKKHKGNKQGKSGRILIIHL